VKDGERRSILPRLSGLGMTAKKIISSPSVCCPVEGCHVILRTGTRVEGMAPVSHGFFRHGRDLFFFHPHIPQAGGQPDGRRKTGDAHAGLLCGLRNFEFQVSSFGFKPAPLTRDPKPETRDFILISQNSISTPVPKRDQTPGQIPSGKALWQCCCEYKN